MSNVGHQSMTKLVFFFCLIIVLSMSQAIAASCVLPVPDGGVIDSSAPSVQGVIFKVTGHELTLKEHKSNPIKLAKQTELFTVYGGSVEPKELKKGQHFLYGMLVAKKYMVLYQ